MKSALANIKRLRRAAPDPQYWDWEATLERSYLRLLDEGASVLDVGAHTGRHVAVFVETLRCGSLLAIEPQPREYAALEARFADVAQVRTRCCALGKKAGVGSFVVNDHAPEESGLRIRRYNDPESARTREISVDICVMDQLMAETQALDFIKIDVEGAELDVLEGGAETIQRLRPFVSVEYGSPGFSAYGRSADELYKLAEQWDYRVTDLLGHGFPNLRKWRRAVDAYYWDYLLVPRERFAWARERLREDPWPVPHGGAALPDGRPRLLRLVTDWWKDRTDRRLDAIVHRCYHETLGREPDEEGLLYYRRQLRGAAIDEQRLRAELQDSEEYRARSSKN